MTLGTIEKHLKEMREQGATDDSEIFVYANAEFLQIESIEHDEFDNSIDIYTE